MKRLLALLGLTCLLVLTACFYLGESIALVIGVVSLSLFVVSLFIPAVRKERTYPVAFLTSLLAVCMFLGYTSCFVEPLKVYDGQTAEVTATQKEAVYFQNGFYNYILEVNEINGEEVNTNLRLCSKYAFFTEPSDMLKFKSELIYTDSKADVSDKIFLRSYIFEGQGVEIERPDKRPLMYHIYKLRKSLSASLYLEMNYDEAAFSNAVLLGDKHAISDDTSYLMRSAGVSHIAVVSGLHLSIIAGLCSKLSGKIFRSIYVSTSFTILCIIAFAFLSGLAAPVVRSSIMLIIMHVGIMIGRRSDSLNSIGAAALVLIISNPYCVGDAGLLLSFAATLGIVFWSGRLTDFTLCKLWRIPFVRNTKIRNIIRVPVVFISVSLSATIWTLPVAVLTFGSVSTVSLLGNILIVPFMSVVITLIGLCVLTHYVGFLAVMCDFLSKLVSLFYNYMILVCKAVTYLPHSYISTDKPYFYLWLSLSLIIAAVALLAGKKSVTVISVMLSLLIVLTGAMNYSIASSKRLTLDICDTDKGLSLMLQSTDGFAVLRASGNKSKTYILSDMIKMRELSAQNVYIDINGNNSQIFYRNLTNEFDYDRILRYYNRDTEEVYIDSSSENISAFSDNHTLYLWDKAEVVLLPADDDVFEYIIIGNTEILVAPKDADLALIPSEYTTADIVITDGIPYNYSLLSCDALYVVGEGYVASAALEMLSSVCNNTVSVTEYSFDIEL